MLKEILYKRTSVRKFQNKKIQVKQLNDILEAGRLAPSGGNEQPWLFGVIEDKALIEAVGDLAYKQNFIKSAPLVIVLCTENIDKDRGGRDVVKAKYPDLSDAIEDLPEDLYSALYAEEHQVKIPATQMIMQATEHNIGTTWVSYFDVYKMNELLELPEGYNATDLLVMGYPESDIKPRDKKTLNNIVFNNKYKGE